MCIFEHGLVVWQKCCGEKTRVMGDRLLSHDCLRLAFLIGCYSMLRDSTLNSTFDLFISHIADAGVSHGTLATTYCIHPLSNTICITALLPVGDIQPYN